MKRLAASRSGVAVWSARHLSPIGFPLAAPRPKPPTAQLLPRLLVSDPPSTSSSLRRGSPSSLPALPKARIDSAPTATCTKQCTSALQVPTTAWGRWPATSGATTRRWESHKILLLCLPPRSTSVSFRHKRALVARSRVPTTSNRRTATGSCLGRNAKLWDLLGVNSIMAITACGNWNCHHRSWY